MELKSGYKQSEVGMIPVDWEVKSIDQFATIKTGPFGTLLKASEYTENDGVPLISVGEIREGFLKITDQTPRVPAIVIRRLPQYVLRAGDIVFGRKGGVERSALIRQPQDGWFLGSDGISVRPSQDCNNGYLAYQFQSVRVQGWLLQKAIGTTMPSLNQKILCNVVVPLPPTKAEQEAIAKALSDADALIESLEQLIAKKRQIKQGAMQELLTGKRRLPGFEIKPGYKKTEVGVVPEDWDCLAIDEHIDLLTGFPFPSRGYSESGIRLLRGSNVKRGNTDWSEDLTQYWPSVSAEIQKYVLKAGDIVIAMDGSLVGRSFAMLDQSDVPSVLLQRVARIRSYSIEQNYLKAWICSKRFTKHCDAVKTVTAIPHISPADIRSFKIARPPTKAEQESIANILNDMDAEIVALETKLAKALQVKQGMMQELLTGRIRLI